jgi:hypothetical protein
MTDEAKTLVELGVSGGAVGLCWQIMAWWKRHKPTVVIKPGELRITWQSTARPS